MATIQEQYQAEVARGATSASYEQWSQAHLQGIRDAIRRVLGRAEAPGEPEQWAAASGNIGQIEAWLKNPEQAPFIQSMVNSEYQKILGRNADSDGMAHYAKDIVNNGLAAERFTPVIEGSLRSSDEYQSTGGQAGEFVRGVANMVNQQVPELPPFEWTPENEANARAYAEAVYGEYFADLVSEATDLASIGKTRLTEDTANRLRDIQESLTDYLSKNDVDRQRVEQDYSNAMADEARRLGVDLETLRINRSRASEDKDRQLAELQEDFSRNNGEINETKQKVLGRLLEDKQKSGERLTQDEQTTYKNVQTQFERRQSAEEESLADRGRVYGGERVKTERIRAEDRGATEQAIERQFGRVREDMETGYGRSTQDIEDAARKKLEEAQIAHQRATAGTETSYERNIADLSRSEEIRREEAAAQQRELELSRTRTTEDLARNAAIQEREAQQAITSTNLTQTRGLEDIQRELEQQQKSLEEQKQTQIETGYYGINAQQDRASEEYSQDFAENERRRLELTSAYGA